MDEIALPIVFTGHIDHGKSTLIGRLLFDTGMLKEDRYREVMETSSSLGRETEFAFVLDALQEERERGITIDTTQISFQTEKRKYLIIDAPGHKEFLKNMITGASYAETAVLIVDAQEGIREQTRRHGYLLSMVGIKDVCVAVNKMDLVDYSQEVFAALRTEIERFFAPLPTTVRFVVPIAALSGINVATRDNLTGWYQGPCLLEALDELEFKVFEERPFRFPVQDVYQVGQETIIAGRVESGEVATGSTVLVLPQGRKAKVLEVRKFLKTGIVRGSYGESVGLVMDNPEGVARGSVLADNAATFVTNSFDAHVFWFYGEHAASSPLTVKCATQESPCRMSISRKFDPAEPETSTDNPASIQIGEAAMVRVEATSPLVLEPFSYIPTMGRIVFEKEGVPVGAGIIR
jgi:small GTP-binding protein